VAAETRLGLNETLGLSGSLRAAVHDIEAKLKEIDDPRTTTWMLMMRRHEKDFMLRRDPKYLAEVKKAAVEFSKAIEVVAIPAAAMNDITAKLQKYQSEFAAWAETAQQSAALDAAMMKTFREIEPVMAEVRTTVDAMYRQADAAEDGKHIDDGATAVRFQDRRECTGHGKRTEEIGIELGASVVDALARDDAGLQIDAGVVDQQRHISAFARRRRDL